MDITLNAYLFFIVIATCNLLLTAILLVLLRNENNRIANRLLALFLAAVGLSFFSDIFYEGSLFKYFPHAIGYDHFLDLSAGPLLYLYIRIQTRPDQGLKALDILYFTPLLLHIALFNDFLFSNAVTKLVAINHIGTIQNYQLAKYLLKGQDFIYLLICYRLLARHSRIIEDVLSTPDGRRLRWLRHLLVAVTVLYIIWVLSKWISPDFTLNGTLLDITLFIFSYWIAYKALGQELIFKKTDVEKIMPIIQQEEPAQRYRNSTLTKVAMENIGNQLQQFMKDSKPYLDPTLSLTSLATQLDVNPNHLSQVINESFNCNFYKFINHYRVEESKKLLLDKNFAHYSILAIAGEAGFNSKSTFNKVFRDEVNMSPSEYMKQKSSH